MRKRKHQVEASRHRRSARAEYVIDCLHLPKDVVMGMELVMLVGNREMEVRHFRGLLSFDPEEICLRAGKHRIRVCGACLSLQYFTAEEVKITGRICSIQYEEGC